MGSLLTAARHQFAALFVGAIVLLWGPTQATAFIAESVQLSTQDKTDLMRIQHHLNSSPTMRSRFLQVASNGEYSQGEIFLHRPGRLRLVYDPPSPLMVIADGTYISYVDRELEHTTTLYVSMTRAELLLREKVSLFGKDIIVTGFERSPGVLRMSVVKADEPGEGNLRLVFSDKPLELRKWVVTDAQGVTTSVSLLGPVFNVDIDPALFQYTPPDASNDIR